MTIETSRPVNVRPRPELHETETDYYETETKKVVLSPHWSRDLNIPGFATPDPLISYTDSCK